MSFREAAADESVVDILRSIEDKLRETGLLVTATNNKTGVHENKGQSALL